MGRCISGFAKSPGGCWLVWGCTSSSSAPTRRARSPAARSYSWSQSTTRSARGCCWRWLAARAAHGTCHGIRRADAVHAAAATEPGFRHRATTTTTATMAVVWTSLVHIGIIFDYSAYYEISLFIFVYLFSILLSNFGLIYVILLNRL